MLFTMIVNNIANLHGAHPYSSDYDLLVSLRNQSWVPNGGSRYPVEIRE
jgi:hypothetical protein